MSKGFFGIQSSNFFFLGINMRTRSLALAALFGFAAIATDAAQAASEQVGEVSTAFRWVGRNDRVVVEAYDDPKVQGVTCYVSRARTGGVKGTVGLAEDRAEASIACRQVAANLQFVGKLPLQEDVFTERMSVLFKRLHIVRLVDPKRNTLVYLTYSDKLVDGSPQNSVTAVPVSASNPIPLK
jgi:CreA protein